MLKKWNTIFLHNIKMSEKTLKFDNTEVNKKEFHKSKQWINLDLVDVNIMMVVSNTLLVTKKMILLS